MRSGTLWVTLATLVPCETTKLESPARSPAGCASWIAHATGRPMRNADEGMGSRRHRHVRRSGQGMPAGGRVGDALGAPVEFWPLAKILAAAGQAACAPICRRGRRRYGGHGPDHRRHTDDHVHRRGHHPRARTGGPRPRLHRRRHRPCAAPLARHPEVQRAHRGPDGWLQAEQWLYSRSCPGQHLPQRTRGRRPGTIRVTRHQRLEGLRWTSSRSAPFGWLAPAVRTATAFELATVSAGFTHGHRTGQLAAGALAYLVGEPSTGPGCRTRPPPPSTTFASNRA